MTNKKGKGNSGFPSGMTKKSKDTSPPTVALL